MFTDTLYGSIIGIAQTIIGHPLDTIKTRIQNNHTYRIPLSHYYHGVSYPLYCSVACNALVFPLHESLACKYNHWQSGALSGLLVTPVVFVTDVYKIHRQLSQSVVRSFRGFALTLCRETSAFSIYFGSYHHARKYTTPFHAGGIAGTLNWLLTYPIDTLRNRQIAYQVSVAGAWRMGSLWSGIGFCLARAYLVNGMSFILYEYLYH